MGDPKKQRKKYSTPGHPWQKARIDEEKQLIKEYGFRNKKEIWKNLSFLRAAAGQAKKLVTASGAQAEKERELLLSRLKRYGLLSQDAELDAILSISLRDVLERRLQTIVYKKKFANSVKQARQFITHEHVCIGNKTITSPSYLVSISEEAQIGFRDKSSLSSPEHPERVAASKVVKAEAAVEGEEDSKETASADSKESKKAKKAAPKKDSPKKKEAKSDEKPKEKPNKAETKKSE